MIVSLVKSLARVLLFWYAIGVLVLFLGPTRWATSLYARLQDWPFWDIPVLASSAGITNAAAVQQALLVYWTLPILLLGSAVLVGVVLVCILLGRLKEIRQAHDLTPGGVYCGVTVEDYSFGQLPPVRVPLPKYDVQISLPGVEKRCRQTRAVTLNEDVAKVFARLSPDELSVCEELIATLMADPDHYAGAGHGVGLLAHTFNVTREIAVKCDPDFSLPLVAALAHDIGKLLTFVQDKDGEWERRGLHSRESARILAAMPSFGKLPLSVQRALLLAVKYDHSPDKMPVLAGDREASGIALRLLSALGVADKSATAAEKDKHLEKLNPGEILWLDFKENLQNAKFVEPKSKGVTNQINWPEGPYLYIYESAWRDEAIQRLSTELAAALDLTRRDPGKLAKYTAILTEKFRELGILVEEYTDPQGQVMRATQENPLWDIRSGNETHGAKILGVIIIDAAKLWQTINRRMSPRSQYQVTILGPNASQLGEVVDRMGKSEGAEKKNHGLEDTGKILVKPEDLSLFGLSATPAGKKLSDASCSEGKSPELEEESRANPGEAAAFLQGLPGPTPEADGGVAHADDTLDTALLLAAGLIQDADTPAPAEKQRLETEVPSGSMGRTQAPPVVPSSGPGQGKGALAPARKRNEACEASVPRLTRSEEGRGVAIADESACKKYPHLKVGDKYYPEGSSAIERAGVTAGDLYLAPGVRPMEAPTNEPSSQAKEIKPAPAKQARPARRISKDEPPTLPEASVPGLGATDATPQPARFAQDGQKTKRRRLS